MKSHVFILIGFVAWISFSINFAGALAYDVQVETPVEELAVFIDLADNSVADKEFVCETLGNLLTNPSKAPWGLAAATHASCDANAAELKVQPHELWRLRVVGTALETTWTMERPLNPVKPADVDKDKPYPAWKTEAVQVLTADEKVRQSFYANKKSLTVFLAGIMQQLPFFRGDSLPNKNNEDRDIALPAWLGNLDTVYVCLVDDWQLFSIDLRVVNSNQKKLCFAQNTWKASSVARGSLTKPMAELLKADLDTLTVAVNEAQKSLKSAQIVRKTPKIGVSASLGIHSYDTELKYGAANSFTFTGVDTGFMAEYYPDKLQTIALGLNWYTASASIVAANTSSEINLTQSGLYLRMVYGVNSEVINNFRLVLTPFLDYCLSGSYKIEDNLGANTYKFRSSLRYGGIVGVDYLIAPKFKVGANANLTLGSFKLGEEYSRATNKTADILGLGGALYLGWNN